MARDAGLPFYKLWVQLSPESRIPINATVLTVIGSFLCTLPSLGSSVAFTAITAMSTITAYGPYTVILLCRHLFKNGFVSGPFSLGRWSVYIGGWGALWGAAMSILFCFPPSYPVTGSTFNYAPVSMAGCILFGIVYWFTVAKTQFHGPKRVVDQDAKAADLEAHHNNGFH